MLKMVPSWWLCAKGGGRKPTLYTVKNPLSKLCIITIVCFMNATVSLFSGCKGHLPADLTWSTNPLRKDACSQSGGKRTDMLKALHFLSYNFLVFSPTNSPKLTNMTWTFLYLYTTGAFLCVVAFQRIHVALLHRLCEITSRAKSQFVQSQIDKVSRVFLTAPSEWKSRVTHGPQLWVLELYSEITTFRNCVTLCDVQSRVFNDWNYFPIFPQPANRCALKAILWRYFQLRIRPLGNPTRLLFSIVAEGTAPV